MTATTSKRGRRDRDMTTGSVWQNILLFSLPLIAANLLQQCYNIVDSIVVGNFVGKEALAAVGSVGPIMFALIGSFNGFATGAGVVISQYFGAGDHKNVSRTVQTIVSLSLILCVVISIVGVVFTGPMLRAMQTPDDVFPQAAAYLRIYFAGATGLIIYNMAAGILRAVGDSRHPLYCLIITSVIHIALDLIFVIGFHWGIDGVAWATVISQAISAVYVLALLTRVEGPYAIRWRELGIDSVLARRVVAVGLPTAIQIALTSISNVFVQAYINVFGSDVMAGWAAYAKLDQFMMMPMMGIGLAATTFAGQNIGAGDFKRARRGTVTALWLAEIITVAIMIPLMVFAPQATRIFGSAPEMISYGTLFMRTLSPFYVFCVVNQTYSGSIRGAGDTTGPTIIMLSAFVVFRQIYLFIVSRLIPGSILAIGLGYPAGWIVCSTSMYIYYRAGRWKKHVIVRHEESLHAAQ
jgi:putative MATE family efflux protein